MQPRDAIPYRGEADEMLLELARRHLYLTGPHDRGYRVRGWDAFKAALSGSQEAPMSGMEIIAAERRRQVEREGWTPDHDDEHGRGELAQAAAFYSSPAHVRDDGLWPWERQWMKPTPSDRMRELAKAGALIAAEMDRLLRLTAREAAPREGAA